MRQERWFALVILNLPEQESQIRASPGFRSSEVKFASIQSVQFSKVGPPHRKQWSEM